jgi:FkbM family methyltransferase
MPGSMELFRKMRPRDTNIEVGIAEQAGKAQFFVFDERALNTFDPALAELRNKPPYKLEQVVEVPIRPLRDVLREHMPAGTRIDFLTVDVEGRDYDVLASNDWESFRPGIVLVEAVLGASVADLQSDAVVKFLSERNYELVAKTVCTCIFVDRSAPASAP